MFTSELQITAWYNTDDKACLSLWGLSPIHLVQAWAQSTCPELSAQGLVPLRWGCALPSPNAPGKAPNHIHTPQYLCVCFPCLPKRQFPSPTRVFGKCLSRTTQLNIRLLFKAFPFHLAELSCYLSSHNTPRSQASSRGEANDSALLSSRDAGLLEPPERPQGHICDRVWKQESLQMKSVKMESYWSRVGP